MNTPGAAGAGRLHLAHLVQLQFVAQVFAYSPMAILGMLVLLAVGRRFNVRIRPAAGTGRWHVARIALGFTGTLAFGLANGMLKLRDQPISGTVLLAGGAGLGTALVSQAFEQRKPSDQRRPRRLWLQAVLFASVAFAGVGVGITGDQGLGGFFNIPMGLGAYGALTLVVTPFVQKRVLEGEAGGQPLQKVAGARKFMLTLKISTVASGASSMVSLAGAAAVTPAAGRPRLPAASLLTCAEISVVYMVSQMLIQYCVGFGDPALVNPLLAWSMPFGFVIDWSRGNAGNLLTRMICLSLVAIASAGLVWLTHRKAPASMRDA